MKNRQVPMTNEQWTVKAEKIRRKHNLNSKSEAVRYSVDKEYELIELEPRNSNAELKEEEK